MPPFPTKLKSKISSKFSYPVGAEIISSELASVPQAQELQISFYSKYETRETRHEPYSIFEVAYAGNDLFQPGWSIIVHPVPRASKHLIKTALTHEFFPRLRSWLQVHSNLNGKYEYHSLSVVLDEHSEILLKLKERP